METSPFPKTLILGGTGFIGQELQNIYKSENLDITFASSEDADILDSKSIKDKILESGAKVLVNLAAYTDVKGATLEKGDKNGVAWKLNVIGVENVAGICKETGVFFIHISTDNVFYGGTGPFREDDKPINDGEVDWYGYTKRMGEVGVEKYGGRYALIRIAYPFGGKDAGKDYILKLIENIKRDRPIFADQNFTPTYIPVFGSILKKTISTGPLGKFHVACRGVTTPYEIGKFLVERLKIENTLKRGSIADYEKLIGGKSPYNPKGGLLVADTEKRLEVNFPTWREAVEDFLRKDPSGTLPQESA